MGQKEGKDGSIEPKEVKDENNTNVIIEKCPLSCIDSSAEGMYILPNSTNCVNIADLVYSLVKTPILLYLGGQDVTHNYTPISMLNGFLENDCLYFVYSEKFEKAKNSVIDEDYIKPINIDTDGPVKIILKPLNRKDQVENSKIKLKVWEECTVHQLELILEKSLKKPVKIYSNRTLLARDTTLGDLKINAKIDGIVHLNYALN